MAFIDLNKESENILFEKANKIFGPEIQLLQFYEEVGELMQAVHKSWRSYRKRDVIFGISPKVEENLMDEIADVLIMLGQVQVLFEIDDDKLYEHYQNKLKALNDKIKRKVGV